MDKKLFIYNFINFRIYYFNHIYIKTSYRYWCFGIGAVPGAIIGGIIGGIGGGMAGEAAGEAIVDEIHNK